VHGRRRIVFLRGPEGYEDSLLREVGYRRALEAHGIPFDPRLISRGEFVEKSAYQAMRQLITGDTVFDAVFSGDDDSASGVLRACREAGVNIPDAVSLVGFDDLPYAQHIAPPLTTVHSPIEQVGLEAVQVLIRLICGETVEPKIILPTHLVIRQSCGCE